MMTSNASQAFVWIWLPQDTQPIVAGKISLIDAQQNRTGLVATQAMNLEGKQGNHATLVNALSICRD